MVYDLVHERLLGAFGADGMWTVTMKDPTAIDGFFTETVAQSLAWNIAAQLAVPKKSRHQAAAAFAAAPPRAVPALVETRLVA